MTITVHHGYSRERVVQAMLRDPVEVSLRVPRSEDVRSARGYPLYEATGRLTRRSRRGVRIVTPWMRSPGLWSVRWRPWQG